MPFVIDPRLETDSAFVRDLPLCQLRLQNNKIVPWLILVPRRAEMKEIFELSSEDRARLMDEIVEISQLVQRVFKPDKINVAALGNVVPQLHIHIIARFKTDPAWPHPVWGRIDHVPYDQAQLSNLLKTFRETI